MMDRKDFLQWLYRGVPNFQLYGYIIVTLHPFFGYFPRTYINMVLNNYIEIF